jgi:hypothetical protein
MFTLFVTVFLLAGNAASEFDPKETAREILEHPSYQKELIAPPKSNLSPIDSVPEEVPRTIGAFSRVMLYLGIGLLVGFALIWAAAYLQDHKKQPDTLTAPAEEDAGRAAIDPSLQQVEDLAEAKRFEEAVHGLFLLAVKRLSAMRKKPTPEALTSRELVPVLPRTSKEKERFKHLVSVVELSLFGGRPVNRASFDRCLQIYKGMGL